MEGRSLILTLLVVSLVMAQLHFQADAKSCCPSTTARNIYNTCRFAGGSRDTCASLSGCKVYQTTCASGWDKLTTEHEDSGEGRTEYCKLGCVTSVCNAMSSLRTSDDAAVAQCTNSCSVFCAKGSPEIKALSE